MTEASAGFDPAGLRRSVADLAPWTSDALVRVVGMNAIGFAFVAMSWFQVSDQLTVRDQLGWLNLGLVGVGVCGGANGLWLLRGRRTIGLARLVLWPTEHTVAFPSVDEPQPVVQLRHVDGTARVHRSGCALLSGRTDRQLTAREAKAANLIPCEVCEP